MAIGAEACPQLHAPAEETGLGNDYVLTVPRGNAGHTINRRGFRTVVERLIETHCRG